MVLFTSRSRDTENKRMDTKVGRGGGMNWEIGIDIHTLLLLSHFSCVRLCATPETAAHQAPLSLGFSRQEHQLPFPSPVHESEKWKWSRSVMSDSLRPHGLQPTRLLHPWDFPGKSTGVGCHCLLWSFVLPHFKEIDLPFWVSGVLHQSSEVVLWKLLHMQKIFWCICWGESDHPILFLHNLGTSLLIYFW